MNIYGDAALATISTNNKQKKNSLTVAQASLARKKEAHRRQTNKFSCTNFHMLEEEKYSKVSFYLLQKFVSLGALSTSS